MPVEWKEDFATGISDVDSQHKEMFAKIGSLINAIDAGKGEKELLDILTYLDGYTVAHFSLEEKLQQDSLYPHLILHQDEHRHFRKQLEQMRDKLIKEGFSPHLILLAGRTMTRWLIQHICGMDRDFGDYMRTSRTITLKTTLH